MAGKKKITVVSNEENTFSKTANKIMSFVKGISKPSEDTEIMAENADFTDMNNNETVLDKIKDCIGFQFYHVAFGTVTLKEIRKDDEFPIILDGGNNVTIKLNKDGKLSETGEMLLYPSKENRDWDTFVRTNYEEKKDPQPQLLFYKGDYIVSNGKKCIFDKFVNQDQHLMIDTFVAITDHDDITNEQVFIRAEGGSQLVKSTDARLANYEEIDSINKHLDTLGLMFDHDKNEVSEKKWSPKKNEKYYYINYDQFEFKVVESVWTDSFLDNSRKKGNNMFKYKASAQEWSDKYKNAFESINAEMRNRKD